MPAEAATSQGPAAVVARLDRAARASSTSTCTRSTARSACGRHAALAEALAAVHAEGLVGAVGVSNYSDTRDGRDPRRARQRGLALASNQIEFSLLRRRPETTGLLACLPAPGRRAARLLADRAGPADRQVLGRRTRRPASGASPPTPWSRSTRSSSVAPPHRRRPRGIGRPARSRCGGSSTRARCRSRAPRIASQAEQNAGALGWSLTDGRGRLDSTRASLEGRRSIQNRFWQHG